MRGKVNIRKHSLTKLLKGREGEFTLVYCFASIAWLMKACKFLHHVQQIENIGHSPSLAPKVNRKGVEKAGERSTKFLFSSATCHASGCQRPFLIFAFDECYDLTTSEKKSLSYSYLFLSYPQNKRFKKGIR
jgi:hypothetical protein